MANNTNSKSFSNSITLVKLADLSANSYQIETNYEEILRFQTKEGLSFSPDIITFKVYDLERDEDDKQIFNFDWVLSLFYGDGYVAIDMGEDKENNGIFSASNFSDFITLIYDGQPNEETNEELNKTQYKTLSFNIVGFFNSIIDEVSAIQNKDDDSDIKVKLYKKIIGDDSFILKFGYVKDGKAKAEKPLVVKNGIGADMAKLNINATDIVASMQEAGLRFSANGLELKNGSFRIYQDYWLVNTIKPTEDTAPVKGKTYYYLEENGYIKFRDNTFNNEYQYYEQIYNIEDLYSFNGSSYDKIDNENYNPGTLYYINEPTDLLYTDDDGNLTLKGSVHAENGYFNGEVHATSGDFNGNINALGGTIGGFQIVSNNNESYLISTNGQIKLDGLQGAIEADNITLGTGAIVSDYIAFSDSDNKDVPPAAFIYNPANYNNLWLKAGNTELYTNGRLNLGSIELNSGTGNQDGYIRSVQTNADGLTQNGFWRINEDGTSYFQNIYANEVHLQDSVLEIGTVQNVGSLMLFKDAWTVIGIEYFEAKNENGNLENFSQEETLEEQTEKYTRITLDNFNSLSPGEWIFSDDKIYQIVESIKPEYYEKIAQSETIESIESTELMESVEIKEPQDSYIISTQYNENKEYYIKKDDGNYSLVNIKSFESFITVYGEDFSGKVVTKFGAENTDYIFSIFGESDEKKASQINRGFATPNSLTISSFTVTNNLPTYTKNLILGNLSSESDIDDLQDEEGFGLYADNVYLKGSLTTRVESNSYAGINTTSGVSFNKTKNNIETDTSPIVFWGGAGGRDSEYIQNAPFQVSKNGTLYTSQAIIENSIVTGGNIYSSNIYAAEIHGWDNGENKASALSIYDSSSGIIFKAEPINNSKEKELFRIQSNGFKKGEKSFIDLTSQNSSATFQGIFKTENLSDNTGLIKIEGNSLTHVDLSTETSNTGQAYSAVTFKIDEANENQHYIELSINNQSIFEVFGEFTKTKKDAYFASNLHFGEYNGKDVMRYQKLNDGYNLYVY